MSQTLVKYWAGWITPTFLELPGWLKDWKEKALKAEQENFELMVFKIPKDSPHLLEAIEKLLQEKIG